MVFQVTLFFTDPSPHGRSASGKRANPGNRADFKHKSEPFSLDIAKEKLIHAFNYCFKQRSLPCHFG
jgi:hypothetical protein